MPRQSPSNGRTYLERVVGDLNRMKQMPMRCTWRWLKSAPLIIWLKLLFLTLMFVVWIWHILSSHKKTFQLQAKVVGDWHLLPFFSTWKMFLFRMWSSMWMSLLFTNLPISLIFTSKKNTHSHILGYHPWKLTTYPLNISWKMIHFLFNMVPFQGG